MLQSFQALDFPKHNSFKIYFKPKGKMHVLLSGILVVGTRLQRNVSIATTISPVFGSRSRIRFIVNTCPEKMFCRSSGDVGMMVLFYKLFQQTAWSMSSTMHLTKSSFANAGHDFKVFERGGAGGKHLDTCISSTTYSYYR